MSNPPQNNDNPAWKPFLDKLPESLHAVIKPALAEWDQNVQNLIQGVRDEYKDLEPYKRFKENNIDPAFVEQAVMLTDRLQNNPETTIKEISEAWNLDTSKFAAPVGNPDPQGDPADYEYDGEDITKHPQFKQLQQQLAGLQQNFSTQREQEEQAQAIREHEQLLDQLEEKHKDDGGINRMLVTAFMSQGMSSDDAVKAYQEALTSHIDPEILKQQTQQQDNSSQPTPVVMGQGGTAGSGLPQQDIDFGKMKTDDVNATVAAMLAESHNNNQG